MTRQKSALRNPKIHPAEPFKPRLAGASAASGVGSVRCSGDLPPATSKLLAPGRSRRLASPNWARNRGVVTHNVGRPAALREPDIYLFSREESPPVTGPMAGFMAGHRSRITTTTLRLLRRAAGWAFRPNILTGSGPAQRPRVWAAV